MSYAIRAATGADLPLLAQVERSAAALFAHAGPELAWLVQGEPLPLSTLQMLQQHGGIWVAADGLDRPSGFLAAQPLDGQWFIVELSVALPHQRQGLGARLLDAAAAHARTLGCACLTLSTYRHLPWNAPYYARHGFSAIEAAALGAGHALKLAREAQDGHDPALRCLMRKPLAR
ncbi:MULTISPECIES: GNAT family N-acetyltransferase [Janthinobacterium]|uniref:GNAT family N-acetyltransferase n=1 Tax=Janthinobacterium TaxID=29580 RepID=UPI0008753916|nr:MULTISPECIES: GNAT family N-acetyltransferase [Janthinobacterium]MCC7700190.1 GNAT family N-acetyltransferase [Janthinobacterium sp. EB271-G4-7A]MCC7715931.1 GNAT family N-acetyltransferase [Janthinobacterium lividum]OEZ64997.1 acetyltransferase (GNAT) family protein [Janthinobacterium lividum]WQE29807.1 GNAT family N-acetyltransferase [Janthinobacterium lividum]STQ95296.1 Predicted acetyltransferase [Janthinobacterium lividum]